MKTTQFCGLIAGTVCSIGVLGIPSGAFAASLTPSTFEATIDVGETISIDKTVTLDPTGVGKLDVFFLADNTGSMGGVINNVKSVALDLLNAIDSNFTDVQFGAGRYFGDPVEFVSPSTAYQLLNPVDNDGIDSTIAGINSWIASGGGDTPEANFFALHQVATSGGETSGGVSTGQDTQWRTGAKRFVVWFGDASAHTETVGLSEVIDTLEDEGVTVLGFNSVSADFGIDGSYDDTSNQATQITEATGGSLTNNFASVPSTDIIESVLGALGDAASTLDLEFGTSGNTSGLDISFECTDALGCEDVLGGESRTFRMDITGKTPGVYDFETFVVGVDAIEEDTITVEGDVVTKTPEPASILGLLVVGAFGATSTLKRKKSS
jgi:hypothetical protein